MNDYLLAGRSEDEIQSVTLVNNTNKTIDVPVPAAEKWILLMIKLVNPDDVQRPVYVSTYKEAAKTNWYRQLVFRDTPALGRVQWPNGVAAADIQHIFSPVVMVAGNIIECVWLAGGASAGGTDADGLVIRYLKYDL